MSFLTTNAVVLRRFSLGESDKIISLLTRESGLVKAVARGAAKSRKRFGGVLMTGNHVAVQVFMKKKTTLHRLDAADLVEPYSELSTDQVLFAAASHLLELSMAFALQQVGDQRQFVLLTSTLRALCANGYEERLLRIFELRTLSYAGVAPSFDFCANCGAAASASKPEFFSIPAGGIRCRRCGGESGAISIPPGARRLLSDVLSVEPRLLPRLRFKSGDLAAAKRIIPPFCEYTLSRKLRSLRMLKRLLTERQKTE